MAKFEPSSKVHYSDTEIITVFVNDTPFKIK